ncbi:putative major head protein, phage associated [Streptomyces capoamus]|jgi:N4-gp56 family major capsid protein|uniref:Major head protein, phage associated n=1 Tax=Streptomyces capoamus TaxID=68183 RepID=A0A919C3K1_9ACTN|nr:N4-gp56 family major capsid protein [Streptomyces capoamus]GGW19870.1 putative major head protein, phage associated [Streptomyces libani subsp. rufus]GHG46471.1 putative major head protein, phage associated [Streptomyces capoamus]
MPAGKTTAAQMIVPDVWADMVQAKFKGAMILGTLATEDNTLEGKPGDTVSFPKWTALGEAEDLTEGTPMTPEQLGTDPGNSATIKEAGKAVELTDKSRLVAFGDPYAETQRQLGVLIARKIDTDLRLAAEAAGVITVDASTEALSWDVVVSGIEKFGDEWDPDNMAGLVIHSTQRASLLRDPNFISADKLGAGAVIPRGVIGQVGGVNILVSNRLTTAGTGADTTYNALLLRRGSLGLLYKRRPIVETDRDILARTTVVTTNVHYATHRLDDEGVVVLKTKGAAA